MILKWNPVLNCKISSTKADFINDFQGAYQSYIDFKKEANKHKNNTNNIKPKNNGLPPPVTLLFLGLNNNYFRKKIK